MPTPHHPMWEKPVHHQNDPKKTHQVHWIELCYDLIHVVAIFLLGNHLTDHFNLLGFISFLFLFVTLWISWGDYVFYNSLFVSRDYKHRIISAFHITTVMIMAGSIPTISEGGMIYFILAYAVNRLILALLYYRARKHNASSHTLASEMFRNFTVIGLIFAIAAFLPSPFNIGVFLFGIFLIQLSYLLPKYGVMRFPNFTPRIEHLSERFSLLLLICLGEGYFKMVLALGEKGISHIDIDIMVNYIAGGISLFLLAWLYFDFTGHGEFSKNSTPSTMMKWWYGHLVLMLCAICIAVALKAEVKVHFLDPYPFKYALLGCIGLVGYLLSLEVIQQTLKSENAHRFANIKVKIFGIVLAISTLIGVYFGLPSFMGNILYFIALSSQLIIPITNAYFTFQDEVEEMHSQRASKGK